MDLKKIRARKKTVENVIGTVLETQDMNLAIDALQRWLKTKGVELEVLGFSKEDVEDSLAWQENQGRM